jgi:hypothetical protein
VSHGHPHLLRVARVDDDQFVVNTNARSLGFDRVMAQQLATALIMVLGPDWDEAVSPAYAERARAREEARAIEAAMPRRGEEVKVERGSKIDVNLENL